MFYPTFMFFLFSTPGLIYRWSKIHLLKQRLCETICKAPSALVIQRGSFVDFLLILTWMTPADPVNTWHLRYKIWLIGYLAPCFTPDAEKIAAQLKYKLALIMLSNELHFCSINLIFLLAIPLICANRAVVSSTIITESCSHFHFNITQ